MSKVDYEIMEIAAIIDRGELDIAQLEMLSVMVVKAKMKLIDKNMGGDSNA